MLNYVTLTGTLLGAAGAVATFTPSGWLTDSTDNLLIPDVDPGHPVHQPRRVRIVRRSSLLDVTANPLHSDDLAQYRRITASP